MVRIWCHVQLINHGISSEVISSMREVCSKFFELPYEERAKYMSSDMHATVRYGTSFNQTKDTVFYWRDFLKLTCNPNLHQLLSNWPSSPAAFKDSASTYAEQTRRLFLILVEAILESLGAMEKEEEELLKEFEEGSQLMVVNCYPQCPEPELTLGMPPHSDYGFLTLLLQDQVEGLQIHHQQKWVNVKPMPNCFVVNIGDHLEVGFVCFLFSFVSFVSDQTLNPEPWKRCRSLVMEGTRAFYIESWWMQTSREFQWLRYIAFLFGQRRSRGQSLWMKRIQSVTKTLILAPSLDTLHLVSLRGRTS